MTCAAAFLGFAGAALMWCASMLVPTLRELNDMRYGLDDGSVTPAQLRAAWRVYERPPPIVWIIRGMGGSMLAGAAALAFWRIVL